MRLLSKKLHSRRGASILIALMFFLICGFVGAVVLGSSVANAEKLQGRREDQQTYTAVSSAARLIRTALDGATCQGVEKKTIYGCANVAVEGSWSPSLDRDVYPAKTFVLTAGTEAAPLTTTLYTAAEGIYKSKTTYYPPGQEAPTFTSWSTDFTIKADTLPEVQVHMTVDKEYTAVFTLTTASAGGYAMTLTCKAVSADNETTEGKSCGHTLKTIDETSGEAVYTNHTFSYTEYSKTTTVTWVPIGSIIKGVSVSGT